MRRLSWRQVEKQNTEVAEAEAVELRAEEVEDWLKQRLRILRRRTEFLLAAHANRGRAKTNDKGDQKFGAKFTQKRKNYALTLLNLE